MPGAVVDLLLDQGALLFSVEDPTAVTTSHGPATTSILVTVLTEKTSERKTMGTTGDGNRPFRHVAALSLAFNTAARPSCARPSVY